MNEDNRFEINLSVSDTDAEMNTHGECNERRIIVALGTLLTGMVQLVPEEIQESEISRLGLKAIAYAFEAVERVRARDKGVGVRITTGPLSQEE